MLEVSVTGDAAVQRRQDGAERSEAPETSGGELCCLTASRPQPGYLREAGKSQPKRLIANKWTSSVFKKKKKWLTLYKIHT